MGRTDTTYHKGLFISLGPCSVNDTHIMWYRAVHDMLLDNVLQAVKNSFISIMYTLNNLYYCLRTVAFQPQDCRKNVYFRCSVDIMKMT
jgi:hypothetical protein